MNQSPVPNLLTSLTGPLHDLEKIMLANQMKIEHWFRHQWQAAEPPFYSSVDLRNSGFKMAPVDTNLFPAGFNNLNPNFLPLCVQAVHATIAEVCPNLKKILLVPESHTRNQMYFENLAALQTILEKSGLEVRIGSVREDLKQPQEHQAPSGRKVIIEPLIREGNHIGVAGFKSCVVLLNNDLSDGVPDILQNLEQIILPSLHIGWNSRLKSQHFGHYAFASMA